MDEKKLDVYIKKMENDCEKLDNLIEELEQRYPFVSFYLNYKIDYDELDIFIDKLKSSWKDG